MMSDEQTVGKIEYSPDYKSIDDKAFSVKDPSYPNDSCFESEGTISVVSADFARELKRKLTAAEARVRELEEVLSELLNAEWMVTHDWGGDRDTLLNKAKQALEKP